MNQQKTSTKSTAKLLWNLAEALPPDNHTKRLLRSFYLTTCRKISRRDATISQDRFSSADMCPKCSSIWSESEFSLKVRSKRVHSRKAEELVKSFESNPKSLTKKQRTRAKWLRKRITTNLETKCGFCQKKTAHPLIKPKVDKIGRKKPPPEPEIEIPTKKKKKKKPKDKTAGLKLLSILPQPPQPKPKSRPKPTPKPQKVVVSQTQKQNSLLQLAKMLKNRTQTEAAKPSSKLDKLLR